jgi:predicted MPP superfamily phosphohydrolase
VIQKHLAGSLSTEQLAIKFKDLAPSLRGTRIVQLSDFHFDGVRLSEGLLRQAIEVTNQVKPDLVLLTGDYVTDEPNPIFNLAYWLGKINSSAGVYAVLGNHDLFYRGAKETITGALQQVGVNVLWNQVAYPLGSQLAIVGLPDYWSHQFNPAITMGQVSDRVPRIVMSHNPDSAEDLKPWRVDLQLSGHTHGGQVVIPGIGPLTGLMKDVQAKIPAKCRHWLPFVKKGCHEVLKNWEWSQGLHEVGQNLLYVNRGLGTYMPGRLFCPPEVTVITLA